MAEPGFHSQTMNIRALTAFLFCASAVSLKPAHAQTPNREFESRRPWIHTSLPSASCGERGIAVGIFPPAVPRYPEGAPVVIFVPGGADRGSAEALPGYAGLGFVEVRFAFPGGGRGEWTSGGTYDHRGPACIRALADVIAFACGKTADQQGRRITALVPGTTVLTSMVGIEGSSHGGNACGLAMATHGKEFPELAFYASMESPYGEGAVNVELGGRDDRLNPAYDAGTGRLDLSKLAWSADLQPGPGKRWRQSAGNPNLKGGLFFDVNGDGKFAEGTDYAANAFPADLGKGTLVWYTPRLIREADARHLFGDPRPTHIPTLDEAVEFWHWRDAAPSIPNAVRNCPNLAVIVYANQRDHVQIAPDHPHIVTQVEGYRKAGAKFVRLNADRCYVERVTAGIPPARGLAFPDNEAGKEWTRQTIGTGLEPPELPLGIYMKAVVCELADRTHAKNWSNNLDRVLDPGAPWSMPQPSPNGPRRFSPAR